MEEISAWAGLKNLFVKILIPALVAVSIKIAITSRKSRMSVFAIISSIVVGVGSAYLFSGLVQSTFSEEVQPLVTALIAISGDKIAGWLIYRFNVDSFIQTLVEKYYRK